MKKTTLKEQGRRLTQTKDGRFAKGNAVAARSNSGRTRSDSKVVMLKSIEVTAKAAKRKPPFKSKY
jgi:hypothetical protein